MIKDANLAIFAISFNQKHITAVSEVGADAQLSVFYIGYRFLCWLQDAEVEGTKWGTRAWDNVYIDKLVPFSLWEDTVMKVSCYVHFGFIYACSVMFALYIYISHIMYNIFLEWLWFYAVMYWESKFVNYFCQRTLLHALLCKWI